MKPFYDIAFWLAIAINGQLLVLLGSDHTERVIGAIMCLFGLLMLIRGGRRDRSLR